MRASIVWLRTCGPRCSRSLYDVFVREQDWPAFCCFKAAAAAVGVTISEPVR